VSVCVSVCVPVCVCACVCVCVVVCVVVCVFVCGGGAGGGGGGGCDERRYIRPYHVRRANTNQYLRILGDTHSREGTLQIAPYHGEMSCDLLAALFGNKCVCVCVPVDPGGITSKRINTYNT
jgi:hypothetical protein